MSGSAGYLSQGRSLQEEFVRLALAAGIHLPFLVSDYLGPMEWLSEARAEAAPLSDVMARAGRLASRADAEGDAYVCAQTAAIVAQGELAQGGVPGYEELVGRLLGARLAAPGEDELAVLEAEVADLARQVTGVGHDPVRAWERSSGLRGEAKWDVALDAYRLGRSYVRGVFPIPVAEDLTIRRTTDPIVSVHLTWQEPDRMAFEVNVDLPRPAATTSWEVAHNIYPGDYLHMLVLSQQTHGREGRPAAAIKLKNAPENVVAEGIEDTAFLRLVPEPSPPERLANQLEWLRRGVNVRAAVRLRDGDAPEEVRAYLQAAGLMDAGRAEQELARLEHPLWGTYQYSYWLGRLLVQEAERRSGGGDRFLAFLYGALHVPATFLDEVARHVPPG